MNEKGFTLVELVVVVALLGILSAVALPRFIDVTDDAEAAVLSAGLSSFNSGLIMARSLRVAAGDSGTLVVSDGLDYHFTNEGWPMPSTPDSAGCVTLWRTLQLATEPVEVFVPGTLSYDGWLAFGNNSLCIFVRTNGESLNLAIHPYILYYPSSIGNISSGTVTSVNFPP